MNRRNTTIVPGILLIGIGILLFAFQLQGWSWRWFSWPFYLILPGILIILSSLFLEDDTGEGLTIFGFILTAVGGILYFQYRTHLWETWAYMWALIPLSVGLGQIVHSLVSRNIDKANEGFQTFRTGLILFIVFAVGFELLIFRRNHFLQTTGFAIAMILIGLLIIFRNVRIKRFPSKANHQPKKSLQEEAGSPGETIN